MLVTQNLLRNPTPQKKKKRKEEESEEESRLCGSGGEQECGEEGEQHRVRRQSSQRVGQPRPVRLQLHGKYA